MVNILNFKFQISNLLVVLVAILIIVPSAFAHVTVEPAEVGVGQRLNFVVSVPTEEDNPTTSLRLVIPQGLQSVRPNTKPGWNIEIKRIGESMKGPILNTGQKAPDPETVTEVIWSGGSIPAEQRDEFVFSAQAPAEETTLIWKAYQTYSDGTVVAWESEPKTVEDYAKNNSSMEGDDDHDAPKPYSETKVINDLKASTAPSEAVVKGEKVDNNLPLILSVIAVIVSGFALGIALRKKG